MYCQTIYGKLGLTDLCRVHPVLGWQDVQWGCWVGLFTTTRWPRDGPRIFLASRGRAPGLGFSIVSHGNGNTEGIGIDQLSTLKMGPGCK